MPHGTYKLYGLVSEIPWKSSSQHSSMLRFFPIYPAPFISSERFINWVLKIILILHILNILPLDFLGITNMRQIGNYLSDGSVDVRQNFSNPPTFLVFLEYQPTIYQSNNTSNSLLFWLTFGIFILLVKELCFGTILGTRFGKESMYFSAKLFLLNHDTLNHFLDLSPSF